MPRLKFAFLLTIGASAFASRFAIAADSPPAEVRRQVTQGLERAVPILETAAKNYPTHRQCFACHHQTLPLLGISQAMQVGVKTDPKLPEEIVAFASEAFEAKVDDLNAGENIGGRGLTVGYGLWTLWLGKTNVGELTDAMTAYLLKTQEADGHWSLHAVRPPAEESLVFCTVAAAAGLKAYAREGREQAAARAIERAKTWLASAKLDSQEDKTARLWGCRLLGSSDEELASARRLVLEAQRDDGGWGQTSEMAPDAYATGSTLYVLLETGLPPGDAALARGIAFLLKAQQPDGSWFVQTRARPVQEFFDNGDPHGKSQFISIAATGWSVAALARSLQTTSP